MLAEAYGQAGQCEEGLRVLADALAQVDKTNERVYEAGVLKPLVPLPGLPEHTKVRITVEAMAGMEQRGSQQKSRVEARPTGDTAL